MIFSSRNYAIGLAHYQISGGLRTVLIFVGLYLALGATIVGLALYDTDRGNISKVLAAMSVLFLVGEAFGLVVFGSMRVAGCIRIDVQTSMIESHRQMPISAWRAMLGYFIGPTMPLLAVAVVNLPVMVGLQSGAHLRMGDFVMSQFILLGFALFIWSFSAMGALMVKQALPLMVIAFIFGSIGSVVLRSVGILPGASLLAAPFLGETIFNLSVGTVNIRSAYPASLAAQAAFAVLFFIGACRRYRGMYLTTFNVPMGVALVAVWCGLSAVAIRIWPQILPRSEEMHPAIASQIVAALAVAALLMIVPLFALATWETRHIVQPAVRLGVLAATVGAAMLVLGADSFRLSQAVVTVVVLIAHAVTIYAALRLCARATLTVAAIWVLSLLFAVWAVPILIEVVRWMYLPSNRFQWIETDFSVISTLSPFGLLIAAWHDQPDGPVLWIGLVFQTVAAALLWTVAHRRQVKASIVPVVTASIAQSLPSSGGSGPGSV